MDLTFIVKSEYLSKLALCLCSRRVDVTARNKRASLTYKIILSSPSCLVNPVICGLCLTTVVRVQSPLQIVKAKVDSPTQ